MTNFTMTFLVLDNAKKNKLISADEHSKATLLIKAEERIQRLVQMNKDLRDINDSQFTIIAKLKFVKSDMKKFVEETEVMYG